MGSKLDNFLKKKVVYFSLWFTCAAYIVRDNAKKLTSLGLSFKDVILFSRKLYVFDVIL